MTQAVFTKWGWITPKALYRFKQAHAKATEIRRSTFPLDGQPWDTRFVGYLIEYCEAEGLIEEHTDVDVPLFQQEQGRA